jgi:isocitrate dehydrogenase kinase/phosphatase
MTAVAPDQEIGNNRDTVEGTTTATPTMVIQVINPICLSTISETHSTFIETPQLQVMQLTDNNRQAMVFVMVPHKDTSLGLIIPPMHKEDNKIKIDIVLTAQDVG